MRQKIPSMCNVCYNTCGVLAVSDGKELISIEGNPDFPIGRGRICSKGAAAVVLHSAPSRINYPMMRTNPEKGIGVDPKWKRISWDEAIGLIVEKLKECKSKDPRSLLVANSVAHLHTGPGIAAFVTAFGTRNFWTSGSNHCGNGEHLMCGTLHSSWFKMPDFRYCNYLMVFGTNLGTSGYYDLNTTAKWLAEARMRGMKMVVVDPIMNAAAAKADEWLPIRPGTDGMLALGMLNVVLNEMEVYDEEFLKEHTNAPYLVGADGYYVRDKENGKPLIWDSEKQVGKTYDESLLKHPALLGEYEVNGDKCKPAFNLLKDHVKKYDASTVSTTTTIPLKTIKKITQEWVEAAQIGKTIEIEGKLLPYRPVVALYFKGAQGHKHAMLTAMSIELLNEVMGNAETPGGVIGENSVCYGYPATSRPAWSPKEGPDGLMATGPWLPWGIPYPPAEPKIPETLALQELFPLSIHPNTLHLTLNDPEKFGLPYKPQVALIYGCNAVMTTTNPDKVAEGLKKIPFIADFNILLDETAELADVVLPDTWYLERLGAPFILRQASRNNSLPMVGEEWGYGIQQATVEPLGERRNGLMVLLEIAERLGIAAEMYKSFNRSYGLADKHALDPNKKYTWEQIVDSVYKHYFGEEHGLEWFKQHGVIKWPKRVEEVYWKRFHHFGRVPLYFEHFKGIGEKVEKVKGALKLDDLDTKDYQPMPDWKPCPAYRDEEKSDELYAIYYKSVLHVFQYTIENPLLDQLTEKHSSYLLAINASTAAKMKLKEKDMVEVKSEATGQSVQGMVHLTERVHPEVIGLLGTGGHWSKSLKIGSKTGKGVCAEWLIPIDLSTLDGVSGNQDLCSRVKIRKIEKASVSVPVIKALA